MATTDSEHEEADAFAEAERHIAEARKANATELDLSHIRKLRSIPSLAGFPSLQGLNLQGTQVSDLAPLAGITALQSLHLTSTGISDLAPLAGLTALQWLDLAGTQVSDLAPLAGLTSLQRLDLALTQVSDLAPLAGLTALQSLGLRFAQVSDLAPLAGLTALQWLDLAGTQVSDLAPLAGLTSLQRLDLALMQVSDLAPLAGLTALQSLGLRFAQVSDLAPLAGLTALQWLDLAGTQVSDLAPLAGLTSLQRLDLARTQVLDLTPLAGLASLQSLFLMGTQVSDLAPLAGLASLQSLFLARTQVSDLTPLAGLTALRSLDLRSAQVSDLAPLAGLTALQSLDLVGTQVSNLAPLDGLTALQSLDLRGTQVSELAPLAECIGLIVGARNDPDRAGIHFAGSRVDDPVLLSYSRLDNPERTIRTINHLRGLKGLPPYEDETGLEQHDPIEFDELEPSAEYLEVIAPPALPSQGVGPQFGLRRDGIVGVAPTQEFDRQGNDVARLRSLLRPLAEAAQDLLDALSGGAGNLYPQLQARAAAYAALIRKPLEDIDFTALYAAGLRLENAEAAARRKVQGGIVPPLEDHQFEALESVTTLHEVFISATREGQDLLADAERFESTPSDIAANQADIIRILKPLLDEPDFVDATTVQPIVDLAEDEGETRHPERRASYTYAAVSNLLLVLSGYAFVGVVAGSTGWPVAIAALLGTSAHTALSDRGKDARRFAVEMLSDATDLADARLQGILRRGSAASRAFVLRHEDALRRLSQRNRRFGFLDKVLDWLKKNRA